MMVPLEQVVPGATACQTMEPPLQMPNWSVPLQTIAPLEEHDPPPVEGEPVEGVPVDAGADAAGAEVAMTVARVD